MISEELLERIRDFCRDDGYSNAYVIESLDAYLAAREAEMMPKLLAAMLEPEAVGKMRDAIKIASENP